MQYGAVNGRSREISKNCPDSDLKNQSSTNRARPIWVLLSLMTTLMLYLVWDRARVKGLDLWPNSRIKWNEVKKLSSKNFTSLSGKPPSLVSFDDKSYGNYAEDMKDGHLYIQSNSALLKGSVKAQCSDTVAWGRLCELCFVFRACRLVLL
jgi:hypothetical protein